MYTEPLAERGALVLDTTAVSTFTALQAAGVTAASLTALAAGANALCIAIPRGGTLATERVRNQPAIQAQIELGVLLTMDDALAGALSCELVLYAWGDPTGTGTKAWYHVAMLNSGLPFTAVNNPDEFHDTDLQCHSYNRIDIGGAGEYFAVLCKSINGTNARARVGIRFGVL